MAFSTKLFRYFSLFFSVGTLYRGIVAPIFAEAPKRAVKFGTAAEALAWQILFS